MSETSSRADRHPVRVPVDAQLGDLDDALLVRLAATQDRVDAEQELAHAERLDDVVVRAELEADDPVDLFGFRGDHDDRHELRRRLTAQRLGHEGPGQVRKHQVEQHDVRLHLERELQAGVARRGREGRCPACVRLYWSTSRRSASSSITSTRAMGGSVGRPCDPSAPYA